MILSAQQLFSDAQAITATARSTNVIDLGATGTIYGASAAMNRDIGPGTPIPLLCQVVEAFNNLTSLTIGLEVDTVSNFASPTVVLSLVVPLASLAVGYQFPVHFVPLNTNQRYVSFNYTVTGTAPTTGKITAGFAAGLNQFNA